MGAIGDIYLRLKAEVGEFDSEIQKAGDKAGQTLGERIKSKLTKSNIFAGIGAATGLLAVGALKMGEAYDTAFDNIRIGTGATGEAFDGLKKDFTNLIGSVPDDVETASQVLADLNTRTGQTGDGLVDLSKTILDFSRITKTDAVANVRDATRLFGDWSIATEDQAGTLDKLLRASQATGIGVNELMSTVVDFGAPMRLLGFEFEEAAALLGKWEKEGVNTGTMLSGLKFGVKTLASEGVKAADMGEALRAKIDAIGASADPVGMAIKTFGLRAGPDLAAAILEGRFATEDLVDVMKNGTDTIEGLADETRDIGDHFKILGNRIGSVIGPMAAGFGDLASTMGPLLYSLPLLTGGIGKLLAAMKVGAVLKFVGAIAMLGPKLALAVAGGIASSSAVSSISHGLGSALTSAGNSGPVKAATGALGKVMGSAIGKAMGLGFAAVAVAVLAAELIKVNSELNDQMQDMLVQNRKFVEVATREQIEAARRTAAEELAGLQGFDLTETLFGSAARQQARATLEDMISDMDAKLGELPPIAADRIEQTTDAIQSGLTGAQADIARAAGYGLSGVMEAAEDTVAGATVAGQQVPEGFAQGVISRQGLVDDAMSSLKNLMQNSLGRAQRIARIIGQLTSKELATGLTDRRAAVRKEAQRVQAVAEQELAGLIARGGKVGKKAMDELNAGLKSKNPAVRASARRVKEIVDGTLVTIPPKAKTYGAKTGEAYAAGLRSMRVVVKGAAIYLVDGAKEVLRAFSPPGPESPLHDIDKWAKLTGATYADHLADAAPDVRDAARRLVAGAAGEFGTNLQLNPTMGALSGSPIRVPVEASSAGSFGVGALQPATPTGDGVNVNLQTYGLPMRAQTPAEVAAQLRRVGSLGLIKPTRKLSWSRNE